MLVRSRGYVMTLKEIGFNAIIYILSICSSITSICLSLISKNIHMKIMMNTKRELVGFFESLLGISFWLVAIAIVLGVIGFSRSARGSDPRLLRLTCTILAIMAILLWFSY